MGKRVTTRTTLRTTREIPLPPLRATFPPPFCEHEKKWRSSEADEILLYAAPQISSPPRHNRTISGKPEEDLEEEILSEVLSEDLSLQSGSASFPLRGSPAGRDDNDDDHSAMTSDYSIASVQGARGLDLYEPVDGAH